MITAKEIPEHFYRRLGIAWEGGDEVNEEV
jgi:hypothetical protein